MGIVADRNKTYHCLEYEDSQQGDLILIGCGIEQCNPGQDCGPDTRMHYHLHVILSGRGVLYTEKGTFTPQCGQFFLLKNGEKVQYIADEKEPWNYCWVTFDGPMAKEITEEIGFSEGTYVLDSQREMQEFYQLVLRMQERPEMGHILDLRRRGILLEFLSLVMEAARPKDAEKFKKPEYAMEVYTRRAMEFVHYNYATITVADIIGYIGFNRSYFSTVFKKQVGMSLQEYLLHYRMQVAKALLLNTDAQIQEISERVGYENSATFSLRFKSLYGMSPSQYRESKWKKHEET